MTLGNLIGLTGPSSSLLPIVVILLVFLVMLGRLLPQEMDKSYIQGFIVCGILMSMVL
jgi:hypothetical protein